jgi:hypothetical protein
VLVVRGGDGRRRPREAGVVRFWYVGAVARHGTLGHGGGRARPPALPAVRRADGP